MALAEIDRVIAAATFSGVGASDQAGAVQGLGACRKASRGLDSLVAGLTV